MALTKDSPRGPRQHASSLDWTMIVAVNNPEVLHGTLYRSPVLSEHCQVIAKHGFNSAGAAYNDGLRQAENDVVVFVHQDVYLPPDWLANLERALDWLARNDPHWGVLGVYGINRAGQRQGHIYTTGIGRVIEEPFEAPVEAQSLDELLLVVRRSSGLKFDERLPGFHLYGTDICLEARLRGLKSYIVPAFCLHNANGLIELPRNFWPSYFYLRRKWWRELPVRTSCTRITRLCLPVAASFLYGLRDRYLTHEQAGRRIASPEKLYQRLLETGEIPWPG